MKFDADKLRGLIVEKHKTQEGVAAGIGMDRSTFYRKMRLGKFSITDIHGIVREVPLSRQEAIDIFLAE